jgi:hypothetical protein
LGNPAAVTTPTAPSVRSADKQRGSSSFFALNGRLWKRIELSALEEQESPGAMIAEMKE